MDKYNLRLLVMPLEPYQMREPSMPYSVLFGDKKKGKKPRPKRKGSQDRARRQKKRRPNR